MKHFPEWLNKKVKTGSGGETGRILSGLRLNTICRAALCPNITECFSKGTAAFMILGNLCARGCGFCGVSKGLPTSLDESEPERIAEACEKLGLKYVVITSPSRDDLPDGGAEFFAKTADALKKREKSIKIELLIPDFMGSVRCLEKIALSGACVVGHNLETVRRLYDIRSGADYERSLFVLETLSGFPGIKTKSGIMLGLGEREEEVEGLLKDLIEVRCFFLSIGQYLSPGGRSVSVAEYVRPEKFASYKKKALDMGFRHVESSPYTRSSYLAEKYLSAGEEYSLPSGRGSLRKK